MVLQDGELPTYVRCHFALTAKNTAKFLDWQTLKSVEYQIPIA